MDTEQAMRRIILDRMSAQERNHQHEPGWSELGGCERKLGGRLAWGASPQQDDPSKWRPTVGTFGHAGLTGWFQAHPGRYLVDHKVTTPVKSTLDLFDIETGTVIDWKFTGVTTLKDARAGRISEKYVTQVHGYGLGLAEQGYTVHKVAIWYLPSGGSLDDAVYVEWPMDFTRAWSAISRREKIKGMLSVAEPEVVLERLSVEQDFCGSCDVFKRGLCLGAKPVKARTYPDGDVFGVR